LLKYAKKIAAVIRHVGGGLERQVAFPNDVAFAQVKAIDAELARREVQRALDVIVAFGPARAAIGGDKIRIGEYAFGRHFDQRCAVDAGDILHLVAGRQQRAELGEIPAHIAIAGQAHREDVRVLVERNLDHHVLRAAVMIGNKAARALVGPFHRPAESARAVQDADIFRINRSLHAKRAANLAGHNAHLVGGSAQNIHQRCLHAVDALAGGIERPPAGCGIVFADGRARLHRVHNHPLV
jgi:hypothetical protein